MQTDNPTLEPDATNSNPIESEPTQPTDTTDVTADNQDPPEGPENLDNPAKSADENADDDNENAQYLELDGDEHDLDDIRKWRDGHMMQSDYTKKTTALADERKKFNAERDTDRENLLKSQAEVAEMRDMLTVLIGEDEAIDWEELKEEDPERYIELKDKADARKAALEKVKADQATPMDDPATIATEQGKLFAANPEWLDKDKKVTDVFTQDTKLLNEYAVRAGFSNDEFKNLNRSHHLITLLKAAKYDQLQEKGRKIKEKREKVPVVTKPKATKQNSRPKTAAEAFFPNVQAGIMEM